MADHLTSLQIEDYCRQKLPAAEVLAVSDHLEACAACRVQVERALDVDSRFLALRSALDDPVRPPSVADCTVGKTGPGILRP